MRRELTPEIRSFLDEVRFGVLATVDPDGSPHQTVMWYLLDGPDVLFNTARGRVKPDNLTREPRVSLMVEDAYRYVRLTGRAREITDRGTTQADIRRLAVRYEGEEAAERMVRNSFSKQQRVSYRFRVARVYASSNFAQVAGPPTGGVERAKSKESKDPAVPSDDGALEARSNGRPRRPLS